MDKQQQTKIKKDKELAEQKRNTIFLITFAAKSYLMANLRLIVRFPNKQEPQTVYVSFRFGRNDKLLYATPVKVLPQYWDAERQRARVSKYYPQADDVNAALSAIVARVERFLSDSAREGSPVTKDSLKVLLDEHFGKGKVSGIDFHDFFKIYIKELETRMNANRGGQTVSYKTRREYARTYEYIKKYERRRKMRWEFDNIDQGAIADFVAYLQSQDLATNTIAHKVISLKALLRAAVERGLTQNERWKFYRNSSEQTESVALDEGELERIRRCDLSRHKHLEKVRDLFLMECWTGLRYSDATSLTSENIQGDMIVIQQKKTNNYVTIPVHPVVREIWERYGGVPPVISNQKFNNYLKLVCKAARIRMRVLKSVTRGGKKTTTKYEKWELVSSHTGRRSFATNLYKSGFPAISIMQITGHKTEAAFLKYIKVSPEEHAKLLAEHWRKSYKC